MPRLSRYYLVVAIVWVVAMTWRIYPQFKDTVRVDGKLTTVDDYVESTCGERVGPGVETCLAETREEAQHLLRREQARSILLIQAPLFIYLVIYLPFALGRGHRRGAAKNR